MNLREIQEDQRAWVAHNFPDREWWHPLLGIGEEVGELFLAGSDDDDTLDAIGDIFIYAADLCSARGWRVDEVYDEIGYIHEYPDKGDIVIQLGALHHHLLKQTQGIRGDYNMHELEAKESLGTILVLLDGLCRWDYELTLEDAASHVWESVRKRDWQADPAGHNASVPKFE